MKATPKNPRIIIAQMDGSGTLSTTVAVLPLASARDKVKPLA
jgi:hypothetical protein